MRIRTSVNALLLLCLAAGLSGGPGPAVPRTHHHGDDAVTATRTPRLRYELFFPADYRPDRPYPVVVGLFGSPEAEREFRAAWEETHGDRQPFLFVRPLTDDPEVPILLPAYSFSSPRGGGVPLTRLGWEEMETSLARMLEVLARRHRVTGAFLVTEDGMLTLPVPVRVSDVLASRFF